MGASRIAGTSRVAVVRAMLVAFLRSLIGNRVSGNARYRGIFHLEPVAIGIVLCTLSIASSSDQPSFHDVVNRNYDRWTHGSPSVLTEQRVKELVLHPEIHGPEAAAIASIHSYLHKAGKDARPLTRAFLLSTHSENISARRDQAASGANLSHNYVEFLKHIQTAPRKAFAVERLTLDTISQGHLGDCYFLAAVGAQVHRDPGPFLRLIRANDDRSYLVQFPNGRHVEVPIMTDSQLALGSNAGTQGIWLNLLEIAAGIVQDRERKLLNDLPLDTLGGGGDSVFSIELLTGHKAVKHVIRKNVNGNRPAPAEADVPILAHRFHQLIQNGAARRHLMCCGVGDWSIPPGLIQRHQYAIFGVSQGRVEVWNPWGHSYHFKPKGAPGLQYGYPTEGGRFSMPLPDFVRVFREVNIETDEPMNSASSK